MIKQDECENAIPRSLGAVWRISANQRHFARIAFSTPAFLVAPTRGLLSGRGGGSEQFLSSTSAHYIGYSVPQKVNENTFCPGPDLAGGGPGAQLTWGH